MKIFEKIKKGIEDFSNMLDRVDVDEGNDSEILAEYADLLTASSNADAFADSIDAMTKQPKNQSIKGISKLKINTQINQVKDKQIEQINQEQQNQRER